MPYMTDTGRVGSVVNYWFNASGSVTAPTAPFHLRLMTTAAAGNGNVSATNGTEATSGNAPGYTAGGSTLGSSPTFTAFSPTSPAAMTNNTAVSWSATGTWTTVVAVEVWDTTAVTPLRYLQGTISSITGVINGDTVQFAVSALTINPAAWLV